MSEINIDNLVKMGTKPIGGATVSFYTNESKDTLFLEGFLTDPSQTPNMAVLKKVTQSLKGTLIEENAREFLKLLAQNKQTHCIKIIEAKLAKNGTGRSFVKEVNSDLVKTGDIIGKLSAPHPGENGLNLFGQVLLATISDDLDFSFDDSVYIKNDKIITYRSGKIIFDEIHKTLTVSDPYKIEISDDKMEAYLTYLDSEPLTRDLILQMLNKYNIVFGILDKQIDEVVKLHQTTKKTIKKFLIAKGLPVDETKQGRIVFSFDNITKRTFEENSSGRVDYKANNTIQSVKKDERIAIIKGSVLGNPGVNILGIKVEPMPPKEAQLKALKNVSTNADNTEFFAEKDGSPVYKHGTISVVDIMQINGNLSLATGNINFEGSVSIEGDIGDDYSIKADGDIIIGGSVGSSKLIAGGNILIGQGFNGRGVGTAECIGDFSVKFMKEVNIFCEGNIIVEREAFNCNINALGQLLMEKSNLLGGESTILGGVFVNEIGSSLGIKTKINPGVNFLFSSRKAEFETRRDDIKQKSVDINNIIGPIFKDKTKLASLPEDRKKKILDLVGELKKLKQESDYIQQELSQFLDDNKSNKVNEVIAYTKVYPGSIFKIGSGQKEFKNELTGPVLITEDIENRTIKTGPIKMRNKPIPTIKQFEE